MDLKRLRYFCTIVEQGQVSRAARVLNMAQPPLSQRLRELEEELGTPLFDRKGRELHLTSAGQLLYRRAREILHTVEASREEVIRAGTQAGPTLRIGVSPTCRNDWLAHFTQLQKTFGDHQIGVVAGDSSYLESLLADRQLDAALMQPPFQPDNFITRRVGSSPTVAVMAAELLPKQTRQLSLQLLARHPLLLLRRSVGVGTYEALLRCCQDAGLNLRIPLYSSDVSLLLDLLAQQPDHIAIVPESEARGLNTRFRIMPLDLPLPAYQSTLVCRRDIEPIMLAGLNAIWPKTDAD